MDKKTEENLKEFAAPLLKNNKNIVVKALKSYKNNTNASNNSYSYDNNNSNKNRSGFLSNSSTYSILPISEVTQGAVEVWATLPDEIREDPSLASFRREHERIHGKNFWKLLICSHTHIIIIVIIIHHQIFNDPLNFHEICFGRTTKTKTVIILSSLCLVSVLIYADNINI